MKITFKALHERAIQITKTYLRAESDLIAILQEIDECKGYRELGYKSLFEYATHGLGLSESVSFNFITVARKSKEVPKLQEMIQKQEITLSNARTIAPVLTSENQAKWLSAAATLSKRVLEKEIAHMFPERQVQERARYISENRIELKLGISEDLHENLKHVQDLVSSQSRSASSLEDTLRVVIEFYIERKDPQKKAERAEKRVIIAHPSTSVSPVPGQAQLPHATMTPVLIASQHNSRCIPARLEHLVRLRDRGQCTHKSSTGERCSEKRWLEIHHIKPLSKGGVTQLDNLTLICRGHHLVVHHRN